MTRTLVLLITAALIAGLVGCPGGPQYSLAISSTVGGSVTTPGEGTFTYGQGTAASLVATPVAGFRFVEWTGDVGTIADVDSRTTTIAMNGDYSITASFVAVHSLTITSTDGGSVTTPGEGTFTYDLGAVVNLVAEAEGDYKFVMWTGDVATVANTAVASTTVSVEDACAIIASFVPEHIYVDSIGPGLWSIDADIEGIGVMVTDEGVIVSFPSHLLSDPQAAVGGGGYSLQTLKGDFDIRMGYELITWPQHSGVRVGLIVLVGDLHSPAHQVNVERTGFGKYDLDFHFPGEPPEVYVVNFDGAVVGFTSTNDAVGVLRVKRRGKLVTGYYQTSEGWHEIYSAEWSGEDTRIKATSWTSGYLFGCEEVRVLLKTVEIVEPLP